MLWNSFSSSSSWSLVNAVRRRRCASSPLSGASVDNLGDDVIKSVRDVIRTRVDVMTVDNLSDSGAVLLAAFTEQPSLWSRDRPSDAVTSSADCRWCSGMRTADATSGVDSGTVNSTSVTWLTFQRYEKCNLPSRCMVSRPQSRRRKPPWNVLSHKPPQNF